ncbi:MAG: Mini-ribonuclease 3 [Clostridia bacterium]|nr:Mini-ribonuclease 3 [Clostridia bacterium]
MRKLKRNGENNLELFKSNREILEVEQMSPLTWAYIGDAVFELYIRTYLINTTHLKPNKLHVASISYVKAKSQAELLERLEPDLTEKEKEIVRRGRNTQTHHIAKNASMQDYMYATAFEALIGYLYLTNQEERLSQILKKTIDETA